VGAKGLDRGGKVHEIGKEHRSRKREEPLRNGHWAGSEWGKRMGGFHDRKPFFIIRESQGSFLGDINHLQKLSLGKAFVKSQKLGHRAVRMLYHSGILDVQVSRKPIGGFQFQQQRKGMGIAQGILLCLFSKELLRFGRATFRLSLGKERNLFAKERFLLVQKSLVAMVDDTTRPIVGKENVRRRGGREEGETEELPFADMVGAAEGGGAVRGTLPPPLLVVPLFVDS